MERREEAPDAGLETRIAEMLAKTRPYWRARSREALDRVVKENRYGVNDPPPAGHLRGIDWHRIPGLHYYLRRGMSWFAENHGYEPDLVNPRGFTEKLLVAKFFAPTPMPSPGDKLGLDTYIPAALKGRVRTAKCVWASSYPEVPNAFDAPPGVYYFKVNHASGMNIKVSLPLKPSVHERLVKESKRFLEHDYGVRGGQWWYQAVHRRVYLEESFSAPGQSATDWKFFVIGGTAAMVQVDLNRDTDHRQLIYDRDFNLTPFELFYKTGEGVEPPANYPQLLEAAEAIGGQFEFARVDFYNTEEGIVLGEITLAPGDARQRIRSPELDDWLGREWRTPLFTRPTAPPHDPAIRS